MFNTKVKRIVRKFVGKYMIPHAQFNYSQFGEDLILNHFFVINGIGNPSYLDIGANEPKYISNTFYFYQRGSRGVLVEPNPFLYKKLKKQRPKDTVLNIGIGFSAVAEADFYIFPNYANGLNTFSEKEAKHWAETGMKGLGKIPIEKVIKMPLVPVNDIIEKYFPGKVPDFISLDVEGLDLEILQSMNFEKYRPKVICIETLKYDDQQNGYKDQTIADFMKTVNYSVHAETFVNTIFVKNELKKQ